MNRLNLAKNSLNRVSDVLLGVIVYNQRTGSIFYRHISYLFLLFLLVLLLTGLGVAGFAGGAALALPKP